MNPGRPSKGSKELIGRWRIEEMDLWDRDALDLVAPAFIEFRSDDTGQLMDGLSGGGNRRPARAGVLLGRQRRMRSGQRSWVGCAPVGRLPCGTHLLSHGRRLGISGQARVIGGCLQAGDRGQVVRVVDPCGRWLILWLHERQGATHRPCRSLPRTPRSRYVFVLAGQSALQLDESSLGVDQTVGKALLLISHGSMVCLRRTPRICRCFTVSVEPTGPQPAYGDRARSHPPYF